MPTQMLGRPILRKQVCHQPVYHPTSQTDIIKPFHSIRPTTAFTVPQLSLWPIRLRTCRFRRPGCCSSISSFTSCLVCIGRPAASGLFMYSAMSPILPCKDSSGHSVFSAGISTLRSVLPHFSSPICQLYYSPPRFRFWLTSRTVFNILAI